MVDVIPAGLTRNYYQQDIYCNLALHIYNSSVLTPPFHLTR